MKNIIVGTAQLIGNYGITNFSNNNEKKILLFLDFCYNNSFVNFDTALEYRCEKIIGKFIKINNIKNINISSKIPSLRNIKKSKKLDYIRQCIERMTNDLNVNTIHNLYFHDERDFYFFRLNRKDIMKIVSSYKIKNLGFSIYSKNFLNKIEKINEIKTIQLPINIVNRDFANINSKKKIIARSIFLQGLLINNKLKIKNKIFKKFNKQLHNFSKQFNIDLYDLCLSYVLGNKEIKQIVLGFDNIRHIKKLLDFKYKPVNEYYLEILKNIIDKKELNIIKDPRKWLDLMKDSRK